MRAMRTIGGLLLASATFVPTLEIGEAALAPPLPGPAPHLAGALDVGAVNASCEACHADVAAEWRASAHRSAYGDPLFQAALELEPLAFCRGCHAPEADAEDASPQAGHELGVACVTCHVQVGSVWSARRSDDGPHRTLGDARLGSTAACAGCHQFEFPTRSHVPMQSTIDEHARSPHAEKTCQDCHMQATVDERGRRRTDHRFAVDEELLDRAVEVRVERAGARAVMVELAVDGAGHAVPTGDMFRRLEVRARSSSGVAARPAVLERHFEVAHRDGELQRSQTHDTRLSEDGSPGTVWLPFGSDVSEDAIVIEVVLLRMPPGLADRLGHGADERVLKRVTLPARSESTQPTSLTSNPP